MISNGFTRKKVDSLTLGEKMRKLRNEGRISLGEVSRDTKIQVKYLEYLENGDYKKLPADVYVKGFLKSYADFFGINPKLLVRLYEKELKIQKNIRREVGESHFNKSIFIKFPKIIITPNVLIVALGIFLFFGASYYLYNELNKFVSDPRLVITFPGDGAVVKEKNIIITGVTDVDADIFINNQPASVGEKGEFKESLVLQSGLNSISVKAINKFGKELTKTISVQADYLMNDETSLFRGDNVSENNELLSLEIYVTNESTWIAVETDGNLVYSGMLSANIYQKFEFKNKISITSGRGSDTFIRFNGKEKGAISSEKGVVKDIVFTKDNLNN